MPSVLFCIKKKKRDREKEREILLGAQNDESYRIMSLVDVTSLHSPDTANTQMPQKHFLYQKQK